MFEKYLCYNFNNLNKMEKPVYSSLPINYQPQQTEFIFEQDEIKFSSKFDSGNMQNTERVECNDVRNFSKNYNFL